MKKMDFQMNISLIQHDKGRRRWRDEQVYMYEPAEYFKIYAGVDVFERWPSFKGYAFFKS